MKINISNPTIKIYNYLLIFNVFAGGFVLFSLPFEFYLGYIFIIFFLTAYILCHGKFYINPVFFIGLIFLTFLSFINVLFSNNTFFLLMKQITGISITGSAYYLLVKVNNYDIRRLFKIYLNIAFIISIIGLIQQYSFIIGFNPGYDYSWLIKKWMLVPTWPGCIIRVNSVFCEPSHFVIGMAPALFVSLVSIFRKEFFYLNRKASIAIVFSYILTFSAIGYFAIAISLFYIFLTSKMRKLSYTILFIIIIFTTTACLYIPEINNRFKDIINVVFIKKTPSHLSTFAFTSNAFVAAQSLKSSPLFGSGLGSHPISFDKFLAAGNPNGLYNTKKYDINKADAASLFLRLLSETGLFGTMMVLYFIFKSLIKSGSISDLQIINNSIFILFILQLLKQGHYFFNGLFFFIWMYYFAYKIYNKPNFISGS